MKTSETDGLNVGVVSLFPNMFDALNESITGRAKQRNKLHFRCFNPRDYSLDKHNNVDDKPYGGGPGMVMAVQPLAAAIHKARAALGDNTLSVYLSPQGKRITQADLNTFIKNPRPLLLVCGRYEGIDERIVETEIDEEWSLGDFVLSGGELAAMAIIDGLTRLLPGVVGKMASTEQDSFMQGLLDYPHYTRPDSVNGNPIPAVLKSGDHQAIARWRQKQALGRTWLKRPDLLERYQLTELDTQLLNEFKHEQARS
jgi:tRNA (guanine37-N1)-methyltransferase